MAILKRETYDEWLLGRIRLQFFEPKLWRWGAKVELETREWLVMPECGDPRQVTQAVAWWIALPMMSIRVVA